MDVLVVADGHYYRDKAGDVYVESVFDYSFYKRYLMTFQKVYAVARITNVEKAPEGKKKASGQGVEFFDFPAYRGPIQYAKKFFAIRKSAKEFCTKTPCAIFRLPGASVNMICKLFAKTGKPFAVELVTDPWENFASGLGLGGVLRPIIRYSWTKTVRDMCMKADGASYVTGHYLQSKYPCPALVGDKERFTGVYSSVELDDGSFASPRQYEEKKTWYISHTANSFAGYGKGHMVLIDAVALVRSRGYDVRIRFIGDGPKKEEFRQYAESLDIGDAVEFLGRLPSSVEVRAEVAKTDMFIFPTRAEGLPRGLLEAMSEGLPCLASPTCGIPEVLESDFLYEYSDVEGFAGGIEKLISNPALMTSLSRQNLNIAKGFATSILNAHRKEFYDALKAKAQ